MGEPNDAQSHTRIPQLQMPTVTPLRGGSRTIGVLCRIRSKAWIRAQSMCKPGGWRDARTWLPHSATTVPCQRSCKHGRLKHLSVPPSLTSMTRRRGEALPCMPFGRWAAPDLGFPIEGYRTDGQSAYCCDCASSAMPRAAYARSSASPRPKASFRLFVVHCCQPLRCRPSPLRISSR